MLVSSTLRLDDEIWPDRRDTQWGGGEDRASGRRRSSYDGHMEARLGQVSSFHFHGRSWGTVSPAARLVASWEIPRAACRAITLRSYPEWCF